MRGEKQMTRAVFSALLAASLAGCSTARNMAVREVAGALAGDAAMAVYTSDDDPEFVRDALPFGLKTTEMLVRQDPENRKLYLACASGYVQYAHVFLFQEAERLEQEDYRKGRHLRERARRLYLRGRDYALEGLELDYPGITKQLKEGVTHGLVMLAEKDVPLLFWAAAGWAGGVASDVGNMNGVADLPVAEAMMRRVLELDESFEAGAVHEFFVSYEASHAGTGSGSYEAAEKHFQRAVELSGGKKASAYVGYAQAVAVRQQDLALFEELLKKALAVNVDAVPEWRLANVIAQQKAAWLMDRRAELFLEYEEAKE